MKRINYNYTKPPFYFIKLFLFFFSLSIVLSIQVIFLTPLTFNQFFEIILIVLFLILSIGTLIEFYHRGEYISPIELYDIIYYVNEFLRKRTNPDKFDSFFPKYINKNKKVYRMLHSKNHIFSVSTIKKSQDAYIVTLIDEGLLLGFFILRFISKRATIYLVIKKINGQYKIIYAYR